MWCMLKNNEVQTSLSNLKQLFSSTSFLNIHFQATVQEVSEDWGKLLRVLELRCAICGNQI